MKNKKALSLMIAYVLLIIIGITLSVFVYSWIKKQIPINVEECEVDISLIVLDYSCDNINKIFNLNIENKGFFSVDGVYIRVSSDGKDKYSDITSTGENQVYAGDAQITNQLKPGEVYELTDLSYPKSGGVAIPQIESIEIEPYLIKNNKAILCNNAVVKIKTSIESNCLL